MDLDYDKLLAVLDDLAEQDRRWQTTDQHVYGAAARAIRALRLEVEGYRYAEAEHEHFGCPVAKTGIYAEPALPPTGTELKIRIPDEYRVSSAAEESRKETK